MRFKSQSATVCTPLATISSTINECKIYPNVNLQICSLNFRVSTVASQGATMTFQKTLDVIKKRILGAKTIADDDKLMVEFVQ